MAPLPKCPKCENGVFAAADYSNALTGVKPVRLLLCTHCGSIVGVLPPEPAADVTQPGQTGSQQPT